MRAQEMENDHKCNRDRIRERRRNLNPREREVYLAEMRNRDQERRNNMTQEEREVYLAKIRNRDQE